MEIEKEEELLRGHTKLHIPPRLSTTAELWQKVGPEFSFPLSRKSHLAHHRLGIRESSGERERYVCTVTEYGVLDWVLPSSVDIMSQPRLTVTRGKECEPA